MLISHILLVKARQRASGTGLDGTSRNHLLAEVVLVLADRTIPQLDGLVVAHENLFGNLVEESAEVLVIIGNIMY